MAGGKYFIQLFPPVMGSCFPPTGVKTRKLGFDSDCRGFFGCSSFLGICSKTSRNRSCLQRKLLLRGLVGMLARPLSQFCEHGLRHQRLHHIKLQKRSYTHQTPVLEKNVGTAHGVLCRKRSLTCSYAPPRTRF